MKKRDLIELEMPTPIFADKEDLSAPPIVESFGETTGEEEPSRKEEPIIMNESTEGDDDEDDESGIR